MLHGRHAAVGKRRVGIGTTGADVFRHAQAPTKDIRRVLVGKPRPRLSPSQAIDGPARRYRASQRKVLSVSPKEAAEIDGHICHSIPGYGYGVTSTQFIPRFRPPARYNARHLDRLHLICNPTGFIPAIQRGI